jgi:hypothetical protein
MARQSSKLKTMMLTRGVARFITPVAILWGIYDWTYVSWAGALAYGLLTINYVIVYSLSWVAPPLMNGPWRIRPWQTFVLLLNIIALPILYYRSQGAVPWGFLVISGLFLVGLYVGTAIFLYLNRRLPMHSAFAQMRTGSFRDL